MQRLSPRAQMALQLMLSSGSVSVTMDTLAKEDSSEARVTRFKLARLLSRALHDLQKLLDNLESPLASSP